MFFGKSNTEQLGQEAYLRNWHPWFASKPVKLNGGQRCWRENIERRRHAVGGPEGCMVHFEYRRIPQEDSAAQKLEQQEELQCSFLREKIKKLERNKIVLHRMLEHDKKLGKAEIEVLDEVEQEEKGKTAIEFLHEVEQEENEDHPFLRERIRQLERNNLLLSELLEENEWVA